MEADVQGNDAGETRFHGPGDLGVTHRLRAVGLDRTQTRRMVRSEATIISIFGAGLGVALGIFFGWAVTQALRTEGFTAFVIPWTGLIFWIVLIAVLGILFAIYPAWRASKLNVLEAISYE